MKQTLIAIAASVALLTASHASAQAIEGFVTGGTHRDSNREQFTGLGGGVLLTGGKWIGVGAQGDAFFSLPYVAGRFTMLVQGNVFDIAGVRPFVQAGKGFGEFKGRMYGAGVDFRPRNARIGVRASYQAYRANVWNRPEKHVQPSVSVGVIWMASRVTADP
jgi:hypothetical protein